MENVRNKKHLILEKSIDELQMSVKSGELSYEDITAFYLDRILEIDKNKNGINSITEVNPNAIEQARYFDKNKDLANSPIYGIPITLKDNINTKDMPTSAGTYAFRDFIPSEDSEIVKQLKDAGALILAKVNLSELANFLDILAPSGYSGKTGQTMNPFNKGKLSPLGSSSGSASSITSNIGVVSIGTETTGSIIAPSSIQSVVGFKPTKDSVSNEGIFPLSSTLDTPGPIAKYVSDIVQINNIITLNHDNKINISDLDKNYINGKIIGLVKNNNDKNNELRNTLESLGATVIDLEFDNSEIKNVDIILNEFKFDFENFAMKYNLPLKTLSELIKFNEQDSDRRIKYGQSLLENANEINKRDTLFIENQVKLSQNRIDSLKKEFNIDAFVFFNNDSVALPAIAGYPEITIPFGKNSKGVPQGVTFISTKNDDVNLLKIGYSFEKNTNLRQIPNI